MTQMFMESGGDGNGLLSAVEMEKALKYERKQKIYENTTSNCRERL